MGGLSEALMVTSYDSLHLYIGYILLLHSLISQINNPDKITVESLYGKCLDENSTQFQRHLA